MTKGPSSFSTVSHFLPTAAETGSRAFQADMAPVVAAIAALGEKLKQEIRVDLPAMNPSFTQAPISVTVPEFPAFPEIRIPPIVITIPEMKPVQLEISYARIAAIACIPPTLFIALQWAFAWFTDFIIP